jgi:hypothetical protein
MKRDFQAIASVIEEHGGEKKKAKQEKGDKVQMKLREF